MSCDPRAAHCITCSDEAIAMTVLSVDDTGLALCETEEGRRETIEITLVADIRPADRLLTHAGVAIALQERRSV